MLEGLKSGNVAETCRKYEIAPTLYYRWKEKSKKEPRLRLGGEASRAARCRAGEAHQTTGACAGPLAFTDRDLKNVLGE